MNIHREDIEIMAPVGSRESLAAALSAGADAVYFGVGRLNMRSHSANHFTLDDLGDIAAQCRAHGVKTYLTVNTIVYDEEMEEMRAIIDAATEAGVSAVIASDVAVMDCCHRRGMPVHLSTQLNISNTETLRFYARFADVAVLARELSLEQVARIHHNITEQDICGPSGRQVRIEMFCHGALCMAVSGKCYLSLSEAGRSANRGECVQICRRAYNATDPETGDELHIDNPYILSPKDLKTIRFLDRMLEAGVRVLKIEGRARGPEYVATTVSCYREAVEAIINGTFTEERKDHWDRRLATVFNRGFWEGHYLGRTIKEWNAGRGSEATEQKTYAGRVTKFYSRLSVAEIAVHATEFSVGDRLLITGPTTGAMWLRAEEIRYDLEPVPTAHKGTLVSIPVPGKVREGDKLFLITDRQQQDGGATAKQQ